MLIIMMTEKLKLKSKSARLVRVSCKIGDETRLELRLAHFYTERDETKEISLVS